MKDIGININSSKDEKLINSVINFIKENVKNFNVKIYDNLRNFSIEQAKNTEMMVVLGGDGTILSTAQCISKFDVPIFGINLGHLGFLTSAEVSELNEAFGKLSNKKFYIEDRTMLECSVNLNNEVKTCYALNEVVISKKTLARILEYSIYIDENFYTNIAADGIIISTPTGATAYALSAGGPFVYPSMNSIQITPICPLSIGIRTMILPSSSNIKVNLKNNCETAYLTLDGQTAFEVSSLNHINIKEASFKCKLIRIEGYDYFKVLRKKIISRTKECEGEK
jgi:NAD+ kinase